MNGVKLDTRGSNGRAGSVRTAVAIVIVVLIALVHAFRVGSYLNGSLFTLYYSYFSDVFLPFGMYFLLCMNDVRIPFLRDWRTKALLVLGVAFVTEVMQAFGVPLLGRTFDPLDFVMFVAGVLLAGFLDEIVFAHVIPRWSLQSIDART
jgi:hypothetical protein